MSSSEISISELSRLTGMTRNTIAKRLSRDGVNGQNQGYKSEDALRIIYSFETAGLRLDRLTKAQLSKVSGFSAGTVASRLEDALIAADEDGTYSAPEALAGIYKALAPVTADTILSEEEEPGPEEDKSQKLATSITERMSYDSYRTQYMRAKAEREQMALDKERGKYLAAEEVKEKLGGVLRTLRTRLLNIPQRIAQTIGREDSPRDIEKKISQEVETALNELSRLKI